MNGQKTYFIIGMPGSGKTSIGKELAEHLQLPFFDTDEIIQDLEGSTIEQIFKTKGEDYFRHLEKDLITHWKLTNVVVATGGGLPCRDNHMDILNEKGTTIWIQVSLDVLVTRMQLDTNVRPLLDGLRPTSLKTNLNVLFKERKTYFEKAQIRVKSEVDSELTARKY